MGELLTLIVPDRFKDAHRGGLARYVSGGPPKIIGKTVEVAGLRKDGEEVPLELSLATWKTSRGSLFTGIARDISERKRDEQLREEYAAAISHDLRLPLTAIMGNASILEMRLGEKGLEREAAGARAIVAGARRMNAVRLAHRGALLVESSCAC